MGVGVIVYNYRKNKNKLTINKIYPNPTQGLLYLNLNEQANETHIKIRVLNSLGALVQTQELELKSNTATLQTNTLPDGIYTLLIDGGNDNTVSKRFVVNR